MLSLLTTASRCSVSDRRLGGPDIVGDRTAGCQQLFSQSGLARGRHTVNDMVSTMPNSQVSVPRTAIVPAAGLGTRFLPATKTVPKELLPVVDTPGIELVAAEAAEAGAERLVIITSEGKDSVVAHFVEDLVLEGTLVARGKSAMLAKVRRAPALIKVESVVQAEPLGLGHAISCVEPVLSDDEDAVSVLAARRPGAADRRAGDDVEGARRRTAARCCVRSRFRPKR